eukprot:TRINITY_DN1685_c0_g1_i1.p1 TRINITY_DN1685_c0_g1~~TRINITY_DN1685_c0_g1_i1.p1  ORF type:complete len:877 (+),score=470.13 TRINITY_DN1685_c0_g1_i1:156-2786(+)
MAEGGGWKVAVKKTPRGGEEEEKASPKKSVDVDEIPEAEESGDAEEMVQLEEGAVESDDEPDAPESLSNAQQKAESAFSGGDEEETLADRVLFYKERECLLLLLEARKLLSSMLSKSEALTRERLAQREREEEEAKKRSGKLTVQEIQNMLQNQPDDDDHDIVGEITELKKNLVVQVRTNHKLDRDVAKLDKRIALLIKNRTSLQDTMMLSKGMKKKKQVVSADHLEGKRLEHYQDLFYILQTEPQYLASCIYVVNPSQLESFLETVILTLFGDAFSPREEFLVLSLFQMAISREISAVKTLDDFVSGQSETVLPKMINNYNRRKQGIEYLQSVLSPILDKVINMELALEMNPKQVYLTMMNEEEARTGEKSKWDRGATDEEIQANEVVMKAIEDRVDKLSEVCQLFMDGILDSISQLPYGLRWLCKQLREVSMEKMPDTTEDSVRKIIVYFVYYRFINLAVVTPDAYNIVSSDLPGSARKALVVVSKVLGNCFNSRRFGDDQKHMKPMNAFVEKNEARVAEYLQNISRVADPEDKLQVNKYMELAQKSKPIIMISLDEIYRTHKLLFDNLDSVAPDAEDRLRIVMKDLGPPPEEFSEEDQDRELQLTLTNRFKVDMDEEGETMRLYAETKELVIPILRLVPIQNSIHRLNLMDVLEAGIKHATETNNMTLSNQINKILENMGKLERENLVTKDDNYESFVHDVALEVANRNQIRDQQRKEIARLKNTLDNLKSHQAYLDEQIADYQAYLQACKEQQYSMLAAKKKKKSKKKGSGDQPHQIGPFKFSYKELEKRGVIVDSDVPSLSRKKTNFSISSEAPGVFQVTAKIAGVEVEKMELDFDDLLEKHYNNIHQVELDQVTMDVNMTIHLINKFFLK